MIASPPNSPFTPDDARAASILRDLTSRGSLAAVANAHGVSIAELALWLDSPDARQRIAAIERGSYVAVRLAATINLPAAVDALTQILTDFRDLARTAKESGIDRNDPAYLRAASQARKAAAQLCRLSRATPIDETHIKDMLAAARARAQAHSQAHAASTHRTASVNERTSPPLRNASVSRVACLREEQTCASTPAPGSNSSFSPPSAPLPLRPSAPISSSPSKLGDSLAERTPPPPTRGGPQDRRGLSRAGPQARRGPNPADLIRAATGPPLPRGSSP